MSAALSTADNVLATAAKCITDVINATGQINVDFADVCTVMRNGGVAILGSARANGENRAHTAIEHALNSPLLNDNDIKGANMGIDQYQFQDWRCRIYNGRSRNYSAVFVDAGWS